MVLFKIVYMNHKNSRNGKLNGFKNYIEYHTLSFNNLCLDTDFLIKRSEQ